MESTQWQLGTVGNHPSICSSTQGNQENLCRDGRLQDLLDTDFQPAFRHLIKKKKKESRVEQKEKDAIMNNASINFIICDVLI